MADTEWFRVPQPPEGSTELAWAMVGTRMVEVCVLKDGRTVARVQPEGDVPPLAQCTWPDSTDATLAAAQSWCMEVAHGAAE